MSSKNLTEEKTRKQHIDKAIIKRGWNLNDKNQVAEEYLIDWAKDKDGKPVNERYVDYLLFDNKGEPLAIVEAKKFSRNPHEGAKQAEEYFEYLKQKFDQDCFIFLTNGETTKFWDYPNHAERNVQGLFSQDELMRRRQQNQLSEDPTKMKHDESIINRPYQIEALKRVMEGLSKNQRKFLLTLATGTGKTRISMAIIDLLMRAGKVQRVLFLTDRNALRQQAMGDLGNSGFKQFFPDEPKSYIFSKELRPARLYAATLQTMILAYKDISPGYFDLIIADEAHRSIYGQWNDVLSYFDSIQIGLTATPSETIDKNTFRQFGCYGGTPTFSFSYDDAINSTPAYLAPYRVLAAQTNFQVKGIKAGDIPLPLRKKYVEQGTPLEDLNFEGTDIGKKVMNAGTDEAIVEEFWEMSLKDSTGTLPGKTIIFAISRRHAQGLLDAFNRLYPERSGQIAQTIYSGMERTDTLIDDFMKQDMPRVAISVDMLDTGIDVPEVVNLVFAKPVFSKIKFWQMLGRGTRPDATCKYKDRLPDGQKDHFLIIDHWKNFQYFNLNPEGRKEYLSEALPVRLFNTKLKKLKHFLLVDEKESADEIKKEVEVMIKSLPQDNISIKENSKKFEHVFEDNFWDNVAEDSAEYLKEQISPFFKYQSNINIDEMSFQLKTQQLGLAILEQNKKSIDRLQKSIANNIHDLPETINAVKEKIPEKRKALSKEFWSNIEYEDAEFLENTFTPIIQYRQRDLKNPIELDLDDIIAEQKLIKKVETISSEFVKEYKLKIEEAIKNLVEDNPTLSKIKKGEDPNDEELMDLEHALFSIREDFTTEKFRGIFKQPQGDFLHFIKYILGLYEFPNFEQECASAFDGFINEHEEYSADQVLFVRTVKNTISKKGQMERSDLSAPPFDRIQPYHKLFKEEDVEDIMIICNTLEKRFNANK